MITDAQRRNIVHVTGANEINEGTAPVSPDINGPWDPWSAKVMLLAGFAQGEPWLWLACRDCGWFLGYSSQYSAIGLGEVASRHEELCEVAT